MFISSHPACYIISLCGIPSPITASLSVFSICLTAGLTQSKVSTNALEFFPSMIYFKEELTVPERVQIFKDTESVHSLWLLILESRKALNNVNTL